MTFETPKLLLIDSYDSFTYNLASLCRLAIPGCLIFIIKNDQLTIAELLPFLPQFSAVIVGPGPGSPSDPKDIGVVKDLWKIRDDVVLPIFGVCLGLQSLAVEYGAQLKRLAVVKHGQVSSIQHIGKDIFERVTLVEAVRYHSLYVDLPTDGPIEPLAWVDDGEDNGRVVMAVKHQCRPFYAVQYHPESVRTRGGGLDVVQNFWDLAQRWSALRDRRISPWSQDAARVFGNPWPPVRSMDIKLPQTSLPDQIVTTTSIHLPKLSITSLCEAFGASDEKSPFVLLDSAAHPGRFTILGCLSPTSLVIAHTVGEQFVSLKRGSSTSHEALKDGDIWSWLANFMSHHKASGGSPEIPFWGGLAGLLSYELGVQSLSVDSRRSGGLPNNVQHPDLNLVFVERSLVLDQATGIVFVQSLLPGDNTWVEATRSTLAKLSSPISTSSELRLKASKLTKVILPDKGHYLDKIHRAKEYLYAGDSYELCLTAHTHVIVPSTTSSWERYKALRKDNPAPHSAYIRLHPTVFLSSSPERFLSYSRPPSPLLQLRPIKGTIRKAPGLTHADAEEALIGSTKEVAENLMIVDLIRHDLHGVVGEDVRVKQFCGVEEYETVWQMVSVIEGRPSPSLPSALERDIGWKVLSRSLPPGSMTGAPKKRSVEILQDLEDQKRSIYSGVFGYWCVGDAGDWAVTIRSCFKYEEHPDCLSPKPSTEEHWIIGAGGAITALSDPEAEWDEMVLKLQSVLQSFGVKRTLK